MAACANAVRNLPELPVVQRGDGQSIIEVLNQEHGYISSLLNTLEEQTERLQPGKVPDYALLRDIIDYLLHYPDKYHHPREDLIFQSLKRGNKQFGSKYERLQCEHSMLHNLNEQLFFELTHVIDGQPVDRAALHRSINEYIEAYRSHLSYESQEIFPFAQDRLTKTMLKKIEAKTRYRDDPLFSDDIHQKYARLGRILKLRVSDLDEQILVQEIQFLEILITILTETAKSLKERPFSSWLPELPRIGTGPSWQARLMNRFARTFIKPSMRFSTIERMRKMTTRREQRQDKELPDDVRWKNVSTKDYDGEWIRIAPKRPRKVLLYFPGGAFVMRTAAAHRSFVSRICRVANTKALVVHYRLAPETPFPGGLEDCLAAYHDLLQQGVAPSDIVLAGDSAGGGLVLSSLLALRDENSPMPSCAIILSALGDMTYTGESRVFNKYLDPMLPTHRASDMHKIYIGQALPDDRYLSPVLADFSGLPPILGQVGSTEILLSDTVRAAEQAKKADVPFFLEIWNQMPHVFPMFGVLPESAVAVDRIATFMQYRQLDPISQRYGDSEYIPRD